MKQSCFFHRNTSYQSLYQPPRTIHAISKTPFKPHRFKPTSRTQPATALTHRHRQPVFDFEPLSRLFPHAHTHAHNHSHATYPTSSKLKHEDVAVTCRGRGPHARGIAELRSGQRRGRRVGQWAYYDGVDCMHQHAFRGMCASPRPLSALRRLRQDRLSQIPTRFVPVQPGLPPVHRHSMSVAHAPACFHAWPSVHRPRPVQEFLASAIRILIVHKSFGHIGWLPAFGSLKKTHRPLPFQLLVFQLLVLSWTGYVLVLNPKHPAFARSSTASEIRKVSFFLFNKLRFSDASPYFPTLHDPHLTVQNFV